MRQFSIKDLIIATAVCGLSFQLVRYYGLRAVISLLVLGWLGSPTIVFLLVCALKGERRKWSVRILVWLSIIALVSIVVLLLFTSPSGSAILFCVVLMIWFTQSTLLYAVYEVWRVGIVSTEHSEQELLSRALPSESTISSERERANP
ncbi:MAG: hypothetical protein AAGG48_27985 [Planctomycetota bacterium]